LTWLAGGLDPQSTLLPAQLLALPIQPEESFPLDVWAAPDARSRALTAARRAPFHLDGKIERTDDGFRLDLRLLDRDDRERGAATASGRALWEAVADATDRLTAPGSALGRRPLVPAARRWLCGPTEPDVLLQVFDFWQAELSGTDFVPAFQRLLPLRERFGPFWRDIEISARRNYEGYDGVRAPEVALDRSTPEALVCTSRLAHGIDEKAVAAELHRLLTASTDRFARAALARAEFGLSMNRGDLQRARELLLVRLEVTHGRADWLNLGGLVQDDAVDAVARRAAAAWEPQTGQAWSDLATTRSLAPAQRLVFARRAFELAPEVADGGLALIAALVAEHRLEEARAIATRLSLGGPLDRANGEAVLTAFEARAGRFGAAFERGRRALRSLERYGSVRGGETLLSSTVLDLAFVLGRERELADELVSRFVLDGPHLRPDDLTAMFTAELCAVASPRVAQACFPILRRLMDSNFFMALGGPTRAVVDGAERYARGDLRGAADAWRPVATQAAATHESFGLGDLLPIAFDAAGEPAVAARFDALADRSAWNGAALADEREARRALAAGDRKHARALAEQVISAWGAADVAVPAVSRLRSSKVLK
jgi:hypothetical protein